MGHREIGVARLAPEIGGERIAVLQGEGAGELSRDVRVLAQRQDFLPARRIGDFERAVGVARDVACLVSEAEPRALALHQAEPGLLDELEQARRRGRAGLRLRIERRFALRGGEEIVEIEPVRPRAVADRVHDRARRGAARRGLGCGRGCEQEHCATTIPLPFPCARRTTGMRRIIAASW